MRTLVIGLDAATWRHIDPLLDAGELPTFQRLVDDGVRGDLKSTTPPMTPLAWTSMATGVNPGKHGIFDFFELDRSSYDLQTTDFSGMDRPAVWDVFEAEDVDTGIFSFPIAFPPPEVGEFFVSGIPAGIDQEIAYPPRLGERLRERGFRIQPEITPKDGLERYFEAVRDHLSLQADLVTELAVEEELDHLWSVFMGLDWAQHYLWDTEIDGRNAVRELYRDVDEVVANLLAELDDDGTVLVVSDHGARQIDGEVHLNSVLERLGYLETANAEPDLISKARSHVADVGWSVGRSLPHPVRNAIKSAVPENVMDGIEAEVGVGHESMADDIDWAATEAFAYGYMGRVFVHVSGAYADGTVAEGDYESIVTDIQRQLDALTHPETGDSLVEKIYRTTEIYDGEHVARAADLVVIPIEWRYTFYGDFGEPWIHEPEERIADHEPEGVVIASGPDVSDDTVSADVVDIAPTVLALHGLPVVEGMDGEPIHAITGDLGTGKASDPDKYRSGTREGSRTGTEEERARERLEDLGYL